MSIKVSIITICYNNKKELIKTINSVITQCYDEIEYIIVDGKSTDGTNQLLDEYSEYIDILVSEEDTGLYNAINKGIKLATGEIIGLIHAGDYLANDKIISQIADVFLQSDSDIVYGNSKIFNSNGDKIVRVNKSPIFKKDLFLKGWMPSHQSVYIRKKCFTEYGDYREDMDISADYELLLRLMYRNSLKVSRIDEFVVCFHLGGKSSKNIRSIIEGNRQCKKAWRINGFNVPRLFIYLKMQRKVKQYYLSLNYLNCGK